MPSNSALRGSKPNFCNLDIICPFSFSPCFVLRAINDLAISLYFLRKELAIRISFLFLRPYSFLTVVYNSISVLIQGCIGVEYFFLNCFGSPIFTSYLSCPFYQTLLFYRLFPLLVPASSLQHQQLFLSFF